MRTDGWMVGYISPVDHAPGLEIRRDDTSILIGPFNFLQSLWFAACQSVKAHYLKSYQAALAGVLRLQFSPVKAFLGGRSGALTLADNPTVFAYLCATGSQL